MDRDTVKVILASAFGGLTGTFIASHSGIFPFLGLIAGIATGYLSYEFKNVYRAVPQAWRKVSEWGPDYDRLKDDLRFLKDASLACSSAVLVLASWFYPVSAVLEFFWKPQLMAAEDFVAIYSFIEFFWSPTILFAVGCLAMYPLIVFASRKESGPYEHMVSSWEVLPVTSPYVLCYLAPRWLREYSPMIIRAICRFAWELFLLIHSEGRMTAGLGAAIGTAFGYFFQGNILVGLLVGGIAGAISREIVGKRILKLQLR